jgi:hypothetical protein
LEIDLALSVPLSSYLHIDNAGTEKFQELLPCRRLSSPGALADGGDTVPMRQRFPGPRLPLRIEVWMRCSIVVSAETVLN